MLREVFYYLLGGVTFLPLCAIGLFLHLRFNTASPPSGVPRIESDVELDHEKKLAALDLAAKNAAIHAEIEKNKGQDRPQGDSTVPAAAKRLGPAPSSGSNAKPFLSGWLTVRPQFELDKDAASSNNPTRTITGVNSASSNEQKGSLAMQSDNEQADTNVDSTGEATATVNKALSNSSGYMTQMYRGILDYRIGRSTANRNGTNDQQQQQSQNGISQAQTSSSSSGGSSTPTGTAGRENFHCILKAPILYLYSSDDVSNPNTECHAAIDLRGKRVSIYVSGIGDTLGDLGLEDNEDTKRDDLESNDDGEAGTSRARDAWKRATRASVRDGELFMKRNAIRIVGSAMGRNVSSADAKAGGRSARKRRRPQWFVFCKNNYFMEDWYHALLAASLMPETGAGAKNEEASVSQLPSTFLTSDDPIGPMFSKEDMASLLVSLDSLPDPLPLRWLNALIGRIFFSVYRTAWLEDYITSKMMKKIHRVKTPGFLGDIKVEEVDVGRRAPGFSRPMLKALTSEGEASMEVAVHYVGEIRITISTTLTLSLGSRFKPYNIPLVLAVVLRSLEGNLLLRVKPPPSNRLWFGFTAMPKMEIDIEPVVSERKVQWGMVTRLIEGRLRELLSESIIVPNMDDVPFFDTRSTFFRGGIFADAAKRADASMSAAAFAATHAAAEDEEKDRTTPRPFTSVKASDFDRLQNATAKSAPVSGAATPISIVGGGSDGDSERKGNDGASSRADTTSETSSIAATSATAALRNRKPLGNSSIDTKAESSDGDQLTSQQVSRITSPAAAGLSDLLSRDLAAGGGGSGLASGSPPRQDPKNAKRKTWFGSSPRLSTNVAGSSGLSALGLGAGTLVGRTTREQSSLALGNASIERPSNRSNSAYVPGRSEALGTNMDRDAGLRAISDSSVADGRGAGMHRHKHSISSNHSAVSLAGTDDTTHSADTDHINETLRIAAAEELARQSSRGSTHERSRSPVKSGKASTASERETSAPTVLVSSASDGVLDQSSIAGAKATETQPLDIAGALQVSSGIDLPGRDFVDSPSSLAPSARSSEPSLSQSDAGGRGDMNHDASITNARDSGAGSTTTLATASSLPSGQSQSSLELDKITETSSRADRSDAPVMTPPPPPPRRPTSQSTATSQERLQTRSEAAAALSNLQRNRYGLESGEHSREAGEDEASLLAGGSTTSAMLLSSWNKAKASMADKEARQAAARDAKDAIKRGWASWNAKRVEAKRTSQQQQLTENDWTDSASAHGMTRSHSSRLSLVPGKSAWLASSPPDPTSFGLGFDKSSPENTREGSRDRYGLPVPPPHARHNLGDTDDEEASVHSNSSGRQRYREHRAQKVVHGFGTSHSHDTDDPIPNSVGASSNNPRHSAGGGSGSTSRLAARLSSAVAAGHTGSPDPSDRAGHWDAQIPSLMPPAPAMYRKHDDDDHSSDPRRKTSDASSSPVLPRRPTDVSGHEVSGSPPALPRRKASTSISTNGAGDGASISFIPAAASTTTGLAATTGVPATTILATSPTAAPGRSSVQRSATDENHATTNAEETGGTHDSRVSADTVNAEASRPLDPASSGESNLKQKDLDSASPLNDEGPQVLVPAVQSSTHSKHEGEGPSKEAVNTASPEGRPVAESDLQDLANIGKAGATEAIAAGSAADPKPPSEVNTPIRAGIKTQPSRAPMMAVPGIPSMQKAEPQSFSAPAPMPDARATVDADSSPSFRRSSLFKIPAFGSPGGSVAASTTTTEKVKASASPGAGADGVDDPPTATSSSSAGVPNKYAQKSEEAIGLASELSALGLTDAEKPLASPKSHSESKSNDSAVKAIESAEQEPSFLANTQSENLAHVEDEASRSFAAVAKAEGPAADVDFETAQMDRGPAIQLGNREVKVDDGSRTVPAAHPLASTEAGQEDGVQRSGMVETHIEVLEADQAEAVQSQLRYPTSTPHLNAFGLAITDPGNGSGRGVFATRDIAESTVIEVSPVLLFPPAEYERHGKHTQLDGYTFVWKRIQGGDAIMALALGLGSLFNHSKSPNVNYTLEHASHSIRYTTTRRITAGQELTISYGAGRMWWETPSAEEVAREEKERLRASDPEAELQRMAGFGISDDEEEGDDHSANVRLTPSASRHVENGIEVHSIAGPSFSPRHSTQNDMQLPSPLIDFSQLPPMYRITAAKDPETIPIATRPAWIVDIQPRSASAAIKFLQKHPKELQNRDDGRYSTRHLRSFKSEPGSSMNRFLICLQEAMPDRTALIRFLTSEVSGGCFGTDPEPYLAPVPVAAAPNKTRLAEWQAVWPCIVRSSPTSAQGGPTTTKMDIGGGETVSIVDRSADERLWQDQERLLWAANRFRRCIALARHVLSSTTTSGDSAGSSNRRSIASAVHVTHPYEQARAFAASRSNGQPWSERERDADWSQLTGPRAPCVGRMAASDSSGEALEKERQLNLILSPLDEKQLQEHCIVVEKRCAAMGQHQQRPSTGAAVYGSTVPGIGTIEIDAVDHRIAKRNPLKHAAIEAIAHVASLRAVDRLYPPGGPTTSSVEVPQQEVGETKVDPSSSRDAEPASSGAGDYLLTGLSMFCLFEPCIYCTMAILHSRVKEVYFLLPSPGRGACCGAQLKASAQCEAGADGGIYALQEQKGLNHSFRVWRWTSATLPASPSSLGGERSEERLEDLLREFDMGKLDP
ncbi:hypothetical protein BCV70DRAFT_208684 [Testicularia cyperi]|uniref:SMP-LTD domain-containing protein n=1 Tax=Testicularia cyperi TaxID=1882483 RepID=A0A317XGT2_9BASI|nr:hypothetical protein BCV70DRAFT_208684 [Testicularia cyperi]